MTEKEPDSPGSEFPVDTLGIPILVDVIEPGNPAAAWSRPEEDVPAASTSAVELDDHPAAEQEGAGFEYHPGGKSGNRNLDEVIEELSARISANLLQSLEPTIQKRINRALKKQASEIAALLASSATESGRDPAGLDPED